MWSALATARGPRPCVRVMDAMMPQGVGAMPIDAYLLYVNNVGSFEELY